ncbi:globin [Alicyclobacillus cycloheptanicus]|nr:globin [Alicyclobacillus cycloheptanicus]
MNRARPNRPAATQTIYDIAGGEATIHALVDHFYTRVAEDPLLKPLFPDDFTEIRQKQKAFLTQFFGGPALYAKQYGAPMMRYRHLRFPITRAHAQAWLHCMSGAMDDIGLQGELRRVMFERLAMTAAHMVNTPEDGEKGDV